MQLKQVLIITDKSQRQITWGRLHIQEWLEKQYLSLVLVDIGDVYDRKKEIKENVAKIQEEFVMSM